jgi:transcriptional regulator with XRE-family HTH domain
MERTFHDTLAGLRRTRGMSQRQVAADLGISQALLSHYENGAREPGLAFVCRVCDYYGVSADYLLCRSESPSSLAPEKAGAFLKQLRALTDEGERMLEKMGGNGHD